MPWSQDIVTFVLFPYLLPSFLPCKNECWSKEEIRHIFEELLMFHCCIPIERTQVLLETFVKRVLSISFGYNRNLDDDLSFLADVDKRCSFEMFNERKSSVYSLYTCKFLIEHKVDLHERNDRALRCMSAYGHKDAVALLLKHKANVHAEKDRALQMASTFGFKDIVALLLQYSANIHVENDAALRYASTGGHRDVVALLLHHKANVHAENDRSIQWAAKGGYKSTIALLLQCNANIHANDDRTLRVASSNGHKNTVALLLQHNANIHAGDDEALRLASENGHKDIVAILLNHKALEVSPVGSPLGEKIISQGLSRFWSGQY
jgi:ankyrin repeat protein